MRESRGILNMRAGEKRFSLFRYLPSEQLSFFVVHYWGVSWDLRGQEPYTQETLPYPCIHLVFERERSRVYGMTTGRFTRVLEGQGRVFGIRFRPGAFYPFVHIPCTTFTNTSIDFCELFGSEKRQWEEQILASANEEEMRRATEDFLQCHLPERDENVVEVNKIVDYIVTHQAITRVDEVVSALGLSKRSVQRLFSRYVGVSPKWVISSYRVQEAAERVARGQYTDWARLALDLGYFDQAHFIKDFKAIVGTTPTEYARLVE